jgi:hypothetical protein
VRVALRVGDLFLATNVRWPNSLNFSLDNFQKALRAARSAFVRMRA